jgi:hypothetical protein
MAQLWEEIMNVPGLTGSWQSRNKQLYEKLGSPLGPYNGSYDQNIMLLNKIQSNDYYRGGLPGGTGTISTHTTGSGPNPHETIAGDQLENTNPGDDIYTEDVMPQDQWNSIFDDWTREFVMNEMKPEWEEDTYNPAMRNMNIQMGEANQQLSLTGAWRSSMGRKNLADMAKDMIKQEEGMRKDFQNTSLETRDAIRENLANPLYESNMKRWGDAPWGDQREEDVSVEDLDGAVPGDTDLGSLIDSINNWTPNPDAEVPTMDWTVNPDSIYNNSLFDQYIGRAY